MIQQFALWIAEMNVNIWRRIINASLNKCIRGGNKDPAKYERNS